MAKITDQASLGKVEPSNLLTDFPISESMQMKSATQDRLPAPKMRPEPPKATLVEQGATFWPFRLTPRERVKPDDEGS